VVALYDPHYALIGLPRTAKHLRRAHIHEIVTRNFRSSPEFRSVCTALNVDEIAVAKSVYSGPNHDKPVGGCVRI